MADNSKIEWTEATWQIITGCSVVSPGCTNCYAMRLAGTRLQHHPSRAGLTRDSKAGPVWTGEVRFNEQWLMQPLQWRKPRLIFVVAHGDLFHENVSEAWLLKIFAVMAMAERHTFQVLTKRPERMRRFLEWLYGSEAGSGLLSEAIDDLGGLDFFNYSIPLPNVWLGTSIEDQTRADERLPHLRATPAAVRWLSAEPLLGSAEVDMTGIDWVVAGGESGPDARPMHPDWARSLRDQCQAAGVPFFFKQWGEYIPCVADDVGDRIACFEDGAQSPAFEIEATHPILQAHGREFWRVGKKAAGALLDGREWREMPR